MRVCGDVDGLGGRLFFFFLGLGNLRFLCLVFVSSFFFLCFSLVLRNGMIFFIHFSCFDDSLVCGVRLCNFGHGH